MRVGRLLTTLVLLSLAVNIVTQAPVAARAKTTTVTAKEMGTAWPLTVPSAKLSCSGASEVFITANGVRYTLNGSAKGAHPRMPNVWSIWADDPAYPGTKRGNVGPLIERGLKLCK